MTIEILIQVETLHSINPDRLAEEIEDFLRDDSTLDKVYVEVTDVQGYDLEEEETD